MRNKNYILKILFLIVIPAVILISVFFIILNIKPSDRNIKIAMVIKSMDPSLNFWQIVRSGATTAKDEYGVNLKITGPWLESDISGQKKILEDMIHEKPSAIILAALDYKELLPVIKKIDSYNIPVITIDSGVNSDIPRSFIATDNIEAGEKLGIYMDGLLSNGDTIAILSFVKGADSAIDREKGVRNIINAGEKISIEGSYYCDNFREKAYEITLKIIKDKPGIKGIIALNDPSTAGAARAIKEKRMENSIILIGFDNGTEVIEYMEEGIVKALVVQKPFNMGYLSIKTAIETIKKKKVEKRIDTGSVLISRENMYTQENQKLLFPLTKEIPLQ